MWRICLVAIIAVTTASAQKASTSAPAQKVEVIKFQRLEELMTTRSEKIQVINFWATWCGPCVQELPSFQGLHVHDPSVEVTLVNLDYADQLNKVKSFVAKRKITARVLLLDDIDYDSWIDRVDPAWGGAIPATLFVNTATGQKIFVDRPLSESELDAQVKALKSTN